MAHVQISIGDGPPCVRLDGEDITEAILADSLHVDVRDKRFGKSMVHLTLLADVLGIDIKEADIKAERAELPRRLCDKPGDE